MYKLLAVILLVGHALPLYLLIPRPRATSRTWHIRLLLVWLLALAAGFAIGFLTCRDWAYQLGIP